MNIWYTYVTQAAITRTIADPDAGDVVSNYVVAMSRQYLQRYTIGAAAGRVLGQGNRLYTVTFDVTREETMADLTAALLAPTGSSAEDVTFYMQLTSDSDIWAMDNADVQPVRVVHRGITVTTSYRVIGGEPRNTSTPE